MCFKVNCSKCKKYSWSGCGKHVASVYANIEEGKHCMCRSWPGVVIATSSSKIHDQPLPAEEAIATSTKAADGLKAGAGDFGPGLIDGTNRDLEEKTDT